MALPFAGRVRISSRSALGAPQIGEDPAVVLHYRVSAPTEPGEAISVGRGLGLSFLEAADLRQEL
jgi:hypothetical protein